MKKFFEEFKDFIARGNVIDMAVGLVIGNAFTKIINSLVENIITPLIGLITGKIDLTALKLVIIPASEGVEEFALKYGLFLQSLIDFLIIAFVIFCTVKVMNTVIKALEHKKAEEEKEQKAEEPDEQIILLREIRDSLKK